MDDLTTLLAHVLGPQPQSPIPTSPSSPVPPAFFANPVRPAGVPAINQSPVPPTPVPPASFNFPAPAPQAQPDRLGPPGDPGGSSSDIITHLRNMLAGDSAAKTPAAPASNGVGNFLGDAAGGMAQNDSTAPPLSAFASGFGGALNASRKRATDAETAANDAADRKAKQEDRTWGKEKDLWQMGRDENTDTRNTAKDTQAATTAKLDQVNKLLEINQKQYELDHPELKESPAKKNVIDQTNKYFTSHALDASQLTPDQFGVAWDAKRRELEQYYGLPPSGTAAPKGDGKSAATPLTMPPDQTDFRAWALKLPKGTYVIDPRDGQPRPIQ